MGKLIAVSNRKGGVGKTTLSIALADALISETKKDVALIDLDPQASASQSLISPEEFKQVIANEKTLPAEFKRQLRNGSGTLESIRCGMRNRIRGRQDVNFDLYPNWHMMWNLEAEELTRDGGKQLEATISAALESIKDLVGYVVIDCPPGVSLASRVALCHADLILCPITPDRLALWGKELFADYARVYAPAAKVRFVATRTRLVGREARNALNELERERDMLTVETGARSISAGTLARFSEAENVRNRIHLDRLQTLSGIYGNKLAQEIVAICNAVLREVD